jgi:hypothetical protein
LEGAVGIGEESTGGARSEAADSAPSGDGAQVIFRQRGGAEEVQRDTAELLVVLARVEGRRKPQIVGGGGELDTGGGGTGYRRRRHGAQGPSGVGRSQGRGAAS